MLLPDVGITGASQHGKTSRPFVMAAMIDARLQPLVKVRCDGQAQQQDLLVRAPPANALQHICRSIRGGIDRKCSQCFRSQLIARGLCQYATQTSQQL